jgi:hypothetical protein
MPRNKTTEPQSAALLKIKPEEATRLATAVAWNFADDGDEIARFLLLVHLFTYTNDATDRENLYREITNALAPFLMEHEPMVQTAMAKALTGLRAKGGAR